MKPHRKKSDISKPHIAIIIPFKVKDIKFKPIPIDHISGDSRGRNMFNQ